MAQDQCISRLGGWEGYDVESCVTEMRRGVSWCFVRLSVQPGRERRCRGGQVSACRGSGVAAGDEALEFRRTLRAVARIQSMRSAKADFWMAGCWVVKV